MASHSSATERTAVMPDNNGHNGHRQAPSDRAAASRLPQTLTQRAELSRFDLYIYVNQLLSDVHRRW